MTRVFLGFNTIVFALFGASALLDPIGLTGNLGVEVGGRHGTFEMRGIYGGVSLGAALLCGLAVLRADLQRPALFFLLTYTGGYVFARAVAIGLEGPPEGYFWAFIGFEALVAALSATLLRTARR